MRKHVFIATILIGISITGYAVSDATVFTGYLNAIKDETNAPLAMKKAKLYLTALSRDDFLGFIRESWRQSGHNRDDADVVFGMAIMAKCFRSGPGKNEPLLLTLQQLSDTTLPSSWKIGLLDVLNIENRQDLTDEEVAAVILVLTREAKNKLNSDVFRAFCVRKLGSILFTQRELMVQQKPEVKDALEKQDRSVLPNIEDANVKQAAKLIDAINDYKATLQKTANDVKDGQIKTNLNKRLAKWEPTSLSPIK